MKSLLIIAISLLLLQLCLGQGCASKNSCSDCTEVQDCGWCGPTGQCLNGTKLGPNTGKCYGDAWFFGTNPDQGNACPDCLSLTNCKECMGFDGDCFWCQATGKCREWGFVGCTGAKTCPCNVYSSCSDCVLDPTCVWCGGSNQTCVGVNDNCAMPAHTCPCSDNLDCRSCMDDYDQDCLWCEQGGVGVCSGTEAGCLAAHTCDQFCEDLGTTCDQCNALNGCAWCPGLSKCVDSTNKQCAFFAHTCPNCQTHRYCDTCQDAGCVWCQNGECRQKGDLSQCTIVGNGQCNAYCGYYSDCNSCIVMPGCAYCEDSNSCVDADQASCLLAHSCGGNNGTSSCGFDGGAFVGGMFLGMGLLAIAVGGFLFYRWKTGKGIYTELK